MIRSRGHCNTMGTASTMALVAEALGTVVPGRRRDAGAGQPAAGGGARDRSARRGDGRRRTGGRAPFLTQARSTTRSWRWPRSAGRPTPWCTCWRSPAGSGSTSRSTTSTGSARASRCWSTCSRPGRFLMEDFYRAGGLLAVLREVRDLLDPTARHRHRAAARRPPRRRADLGRRGHPSRARRRCSPRAASPCCAATSRRTARSSSRRRRRRTCSSTAAGRWCSTSIEDFHARIDDPDLDVDADSVLVLRGCGPKGYPGMPEVSNMPLPPEAARRRACATWCASATGG